MKTAAMKACISLALIGLFAASATSAAAGLGEVPSDSIDSCIAEIRAHADYSNAGRVRHVLREFGHRSLAHKLRISTAVYDESGKELIRAYSTKCIVYGDEEPVFFRIEAADKGA